MGHPVDDVETTELDKMSAVRERSQEIGEFIEWLPTKGLAVGEWVEVEGYREKQFWVTTRSIEDLLAEYFEIDLKKVEQERRALLDALRNSQD